MVYSPSGTQLASGSYDNTVRLWDAESGAAGYTLEGHTSYVLSVVYSPSGTQLASGSDDKTVRLWEVTSGQCQAVIKDFFGGVNSVAWKEVPEGSYLLTGSDDKLVRQWQVIEKGGGYKVRLGWMSPHGELKVNDVSIDRVEGLSDLNRGFLDQRGSVSRLREVGRKIMMLGSSQRKLEAGA